jgi:hypothetical protein
VVENLDTEESQYHLINTRADLGSEFGLEATSGFDFTCKLLLKEGDNLEFGYDEAVNFYFNMGEETDHLSTLLVFYETSEIDAETDEETFTEHYTFISQGTYFDIVNPTDNFEILALMDYDESA